ncbi:MAG: hypothetical protein RI963_2917 [Planctomycetota bacterium]
MGRIGLGLAAASGEGPQAAKRFGADVVFDPFGIDRRRLGGNAQRDQEIVDGVVTFLRSRREFQALAGQLDRLVTLCLDEAERFEAAEDAADRDMANGEVAGEVDDAAGRPRRVRRWGTETCDVFGEAVNATVPACEGG